MKSTKFILTTILVVLAAALLFACSPPAEKVAPEQITWTFCNGYGPGGYGGMKPGDFIISVYAQTSAGLFKVDSESVDDSESGRVSFIQMVNNKINTYVNLNQMPSEKVKITEIPFPSGGNAFCVNSIGKSTEQIKQLYIYKFSNPE